jgi:hypothetical protein
MGCQPKIFPKENQGNMPSDAQWPPGFQNVLLAYLWEGREGLALFFRLTGLEHLNQFRHSSFPFPRGTMDGPPRLSYFIHGEKPMCLRLDQRDFNLEIVLNSSLEPGGFDVWRLEYFVRHNPALIDGGYDGSRVAGHFAHASKQGLIVQPQEQGGNALFYMKEP